MLALEAVCESISDYKEYLKRAIELGLIEVSGEPDESKRVYRAGRILPQIIPSIQLSLAPKVYSLYQKAHEKLHQLWGNEENESEDKWREIFRLKFANRENPKRFREGFSQMLAVQYNSEADNAYESELRKCADDLVKDELCKSLENYLKQKQWKEADEETAWIFYQVMVKEKYQNWEDLSENFPCETLRGINRLWLENSNNKFGISIQTKIYQDLGGTKEYNAEVWEKFCDSEALLRSADRVGWRKEGRYLIYNDIMPSSDITTDMTQAAGGASALFLPALPTMLYTREWEGTVGGWGFVLGTFYRGVYSRRGIARQAIFFSRAETCKV